MAEGDDKTKFKSEIIDLVASAMSITDVVSIEQSAFASRVSSSGGMPSGIWYFTYNSNPLALLFWHGEKAEFSVVANASTSAKVDCNNLKKETAWTKRAKESTGLKVTRGYLRAQILIAAGEWT